MSTEKTSQSAPVDALVLPLRDVIAFDGNVDAELFGKLLKAADRHLKTNARLTVPEMEAVRRACSVIEAVLTNTICVSE